MPEIDTDNEYGDVIVKGSGYNQDLRNQDVHQLVTGQFGADFTGLANNWVDYLGGIIDQVWQAIQGVLQTAGQIGADLITGLIDGFNGFLQMIQNVLEGNTSAFEQGSTFEDMADGQRAFNDRVDLLEDVSGYANYTAGGTAQIVGHWSDADGYPLVFSEKIGPEKGASHYYGRWVADKDFRYQWADGILFDSPGTWRVDTMFVSQGVFTVGGWAKFQAEITVKDISQPHYPPFSRKIYYNECVEYHRTHQIAHTVVIPEGGRYAVFVTIKHNRNGAIRFPGGDSFTFLSVNRWNLSTANPNPSPGAGLPDSSGT